MITDTVTDQSAGQKGSPAISDASMSGYMEYLYMDYAKPDATGVTVKLTAIDPNKNLIDIATVTSDMNGNFGYLWTPQSKAHTRSLQHSLDPTLTEARTPLPTWE